jgi:hypothetical protein
MMELEKEYPAVELTKTCKKGKRFRRSTIVYNFINYIVKNVYLINDDIDDIDDIDDNKKTE